jgi:hypothetical protein
MQSGRIALNVSILHTMTKTFHSETANAYGNPAPLISIKAAAFFAGPWMRR